MIKLHSIFYKNFLSVGDNGIKILLDRSDTTLITAPNGSGKSALSDAITFALFGKSYRGSKKQNMINRTNKKDCLVEIEFHKGNDHYKIIRGMKPTLFEIYKNNAVVDAEAAVRDYQNFLESQVLGFNFKSFCQTAILGTSNYIPFMQLPTGYRREVIENLFGINVFSDMNKLLKQKVSDWKKDVTDVKNDIDASHREINLLKGFILLLETDDAKKVDASKARIKIIKEDINAHILEIKSIEGTAIESKEYKSIDEGITSLRSTTRNQFESRNKIQKEVNDAHTKVGIIEKNIEKLIGVDGKECPLCKQGVDHVHVSKLTELLSREISALTASMVAPKSHLETLDDMIASVDAEIQNLSGCSRIIDNKHRDIKALAANGRILLDEIQTMTQPKSASSLDSEKEKLHEANGKLKALESRLEHLLSKEKVYRISIDLLKDTGIKSKIIAQYMPVLNQRVNHYLTLLNFNVRFELDENFNETLKSRNMSEFTYTDFSQGERQRIDLAILFGWRDLATLMNSVSCNLLILDETADASLDGNGVEDLLNIISSLKSSNVFMVSHKQNLEAIMQATIKFQKIKGFTEIVD
jgi:DNA repair exonuclease SbcCD ATPase subunit